jgi:co-chaperonin GroES (HSP10)
LRVPILQSSPTRNEENSEACRLPRGDDSKLQPLDVKIANRVLFAKWSSTEIKIDREDFAVAKESDIMGVVE